ncbi:hypothetical protein PYW07_015167 [Mythimna separata]|uniref:TIL domain-containing protein n=1 Tax=Mythimna separata TaxID=271217 RepID=A0AAD7Z0C9_MYTSE|nr:hypothetical protein PYW07_015167 [Mythimna separata]
MTRKVLVILFVIFFTIHNTVQLQCPPGEDEDNCPTDCYRDRCPTSEKDGRDCVNSGQCGTPKCKCRFNMKRAMNGTCIDTRDCPPFECDRPNEEYVACPPYCPTDDCRQSTADGKCPIFGQILMVVECTPACRCIEGYWRMDGLCVPFDVCPQHSTVPNRLE